MRRVTRHVQAISKEISEISPPARYSLDQETFYTLVTLLSYSLRAAIPINDSATQTFNCNVAEPALESGLQKENIKNASFPSNCHKQETSSGVNVKRRSISPRQAVQLVSDILETASDLMLVRNNMSCSTNELKCYPHSLLNLFFWFIFPRSTSCFTRPRSTESALAVFLYMPPTKTKPPQSSAAAQLPSTCPPR